MGACARHLGHRASTEDLVLNACGECFLYPSEARCLNAGLSFHLLCMRASKALASPYICACSPGLELLTNVRHQMLV